MNPLAATLLTPFGAGVVAYFLIGFRSDATSPPMRRRRIGGAAVGIFTFSLGLYLVIQNDLPTLVLLGYIVPCFAAAIGGEVLARRIDRITD